MAAIAEVNMTARSNRRLMGALIGAVPGALLWVVGAIVGGEALLSFGVIGIMVAVVGMIIGGVVAGGASPVADGSQPVAGGTSKAAIGAVLGVIPGVVLLFIMTRLAIPVMLVGGVLGAMIGGRLGPGSTPPRPVH